MQAFRKKKKKDKKVFILIGVPVNDGLIHEKVIMIEYFRKKLKNNSYTVKIFNTDNYDKLFKAEFVFLIADYRQLSSSITYSKEYLRLLN